MSGEAYELPETRLDLQEPVLASIEEVKWARLILIFFITVKLGTDTYNWKIIAKMFAVP